MKTIDFKSGEITYNEFRIDFSLPFTEQENSLTEDLLLVEYENGYMIDLGWYPEFDKKGRFVLQLIYNGNWEKPIYKKKSRRWTHIRKALLKAIDIAHE